MVEKPNIRAMLKNDNKVHHLCSVVTTIGGRGCDVQLEGDDIEDLHAIIKFNDINKTYNIIDINTRHGTKVNRCLLDHCFHRLSNGDCIVFGRKETPLNFLVTSSPVEPEGRKNDITQRTNAAEEFSMLFDEASERCKNSINKRHDELKQQMLLNEQCGKNQQLQHRQHPSQQFQQQPQQPLSNNIEKETGYLSINDLRTPPLTDEFTQNPVEEETEGCSSKKIRDVIKGIETRQSMEEMWLRMEDMKQEKMEFMNLFSNLHSDMQSKDEILRTTADTAEHLRKENACLLIQNEALINSVARKYCDCDGCRQEDAIIQKDMEVIKLKVQLQMKVEAVDELKRCTQCMGDELEKIKRENDQLKKCLKSADDELRSSKRKSEEFQRAEVLGRVNGERMIKQLELLKKPILEMVNVLCGDEEAVEPSFSSINAICRTKVPLTSTTAQPASPMPSTIKGSKPAKSAGGTMGPPDAEDKSRAGFGGRNECLDYEMSNVPIIDDMDKIINAADECITKIKRLKSQGQPLPGQNVGTSNGNAPLPPPPPPPPTGDKKKKKK